MLNIREELQMARTVKDCNRFPWEAVKQESFTFRSKGHVLGIASSS